MSDDKTDKVEIRPIYSNLDLRRTHSIQQKVFGYRDIDVIPATHLLTVQRNGGMVLDMEDEVLLVHLPSSLTEIDGETLKLRLAGGIRPECL